jgi:tRNA(fMet)-specific endonuclease VapC
VNKALLDTDVFSEILKQKNPAILTHTIAYLRQHQRFTLSVLTVIEIVTGYRQAGRTAQLPSFFDALATNEVLPLGLQEARIAGDILGALRKAGQTIGHFDPMIAAIAIANNLSLVSGNTDHFERVRQLGYILPLENWREAMP